MYRKAKRQLLESSMLGSVKVGDGTRAAAPPRASVKRKARARSRAVLLSSAPPDWLFKQRTQCGPPIRGLPAKPRPTAATPRPPPPPLLTLGCCETKTQTGQKEKVVIYSSCCFCFYSLTHRNLWTTAI